MLEHYVIQDFRNHPAINTRFEMHSSNPVAPLDGRYWYNSDINIPYVRANGINLPLVAKDDNFYNAPEITSNNDQDALLVWSHIATSNYQYDKYRRISFANLKAQFGTVNNAFSILSGNTGANIIASGQQSFSIWGDNVVLETSGNNATKRLTLQFKSQGQGLFFAGPSSGGPGLPSFRSIMISDLPPGLMQGYTKAEVDAFFEGESAGKKLVHWNNILYKPLLEPTLGNPPVDGYVLSSTVAGIRSWIEMTGGGGDGYWSRTGTIISPATTGDTLAINTIVEETLDAGVTVQSVFKVDNGSIPGQSTMAHGLVINSSNGNQSIDNFRVNTYLYIALQTDSSDNSVSLMSNINGKIGFFGATPTVRSSGWNPTNNTVLKSYNVTATTINELARTLASIIEELKEKGLIGN